MYLQLWALGRSAYPDILASKGHPYVSASDVQLSHRASPPRPLTKSEIAEYVKLYASAAANAAEAGFDGGQRSSYNDPNCVLTPALKWRYTLQTATSWINSYRQQAMFARTSTAVASRTGSASSKRSLTPLRPRSAPTEQPLGLAPGEHFKVSGIPCSVGRVTDHV